jgi:hypothetical protein
MTKTLFTLNVGDYEPEVCKITYPLMTAYAEKIGAEFKVIRDRKFPGWPDVYEKLQIHELGRDSDWIIYVDSDALIHPSTPDFTALLPRNTVCHHGRDMAGNRWRYDDYFLRDGRNIGSCNWFTIASNLCLDLWAPLSDMTLQEAVANIFPTVRERNAGVKPEHLIDDYVVSRNIARFGLKFTTIIELLKSLGLENGYFHHQYAQPARVKIEGFHKALRTWGVEEVSNG